MDAVYPAGASALGRGRRARRPAPRLRHRTLPVTFAEIKEVDEECEEAAAAEERRRRPDILAEPLADPLGRQFAEFRRRRARRDVIREPAEPEEPPAGGPLAPHSASQPPPGTAAAAAALATAATSPAASATAPNTAALPALASGFVDPTAVVNKRLPEM